MIANRHPAREMPSVFPFVLFRVFRGSAFSTKTRTSDFILRRRLRFALPIAIVSFTCRFARLAGRIARSIFVTFTELLSLAFMSDVKAQIESLKAAFIEELGHLSDVSVDGISL